MEAIYGNYADDLKFSKVRDGVDNKCTIKNILPRIRERRRVGRVIKQNFAKPREIASLSSRRERYTFRCVYDNAAGECEPADADGTQFKS